MRADERVQLAIAAAGLEPCECAVDPVHGLMVSAAGLRKMAALAGDAAMRLHLIELADRADAVGLPPLH